MTIDDEDLLDRVVERLVGLRHVCGSRLFHAAAYQALTAIARTVLEDAERRCKESANEEVKILRFPMGGRLRHGGFGRSCSTRAQTLDGEVIGPTTGELDDG